MYACGNGNCQDKDLEWENGCELTQQNDLDFIGLFMNEAAAMDCSVMQDEARKNPQMFYHHLHIDLSMEYETVPTASVTSLPPGTIFCNAGLGPSATLGRCEFRCVPGFKNEDFRSFNGCEAEDSVIPYPFIGDDILGYGGFAIGDYQTMMFIDFMCKIADGTYDGVFITPPRNICASQYFYGNYSDYQENDYPVYWY
jgi:hypothetical protein